MSLAHNSAVDQSVHASKTGSNGAARRAAALALGATVFLMMVPVTLIVPVLKELVADPFGASAFWTHSFMSVNMIGAVLAAPWIAVVCDRVGSRARTAVAALALEGALLAAMSVAPSLAILLIIRALEGACHLLALSAVMAMAADSAAPGRRGRTMGVLGTCMMLGTATGTRIGGLLWDAWPGWAFESAACVAFAAAIFVALAVRDPARRTVGRSVRDALALLRERRELLIAYAYTFIDRFCVGVIISTFVLYLANVHALPPDGRSTLLTLFLCPFALLIYPAGRLVDRIGPTIPLVLGSAAFGLIFASYGLLPSGWLPGVMLLSGAVSAIMFAPTLSLCADLSPADRRGTAYAGFNAAGALGFVCGPLVAGAVVHLLAGAIGDLAAYRAAFIVAGAAETACAAITLPLLLKLSRRRAAAGP